MTHRSSNLGGIFTSYVQIFWKGFGNSSLPVRVLPADTTDIGSILTIYNGQSYTMATDPQPNTIASQTSTVKLIYQQISGILIDTRLKNTTGFLASTT